MYDLSMQECRWLRVSHHQIKNAAKSEEHCDSGQQCADETQRSSPCELFDGISKDCSFVHYCCALCTGCWFLEMHELPAKENLTFIDFSR